MKRNQQRRAIVASLLLGTRPCTDEDCPVAVEVFKGLTADPLTVASQVAKIRERFGLAAGRAGG